MKILFILPSLSFEHAVKKILEEANEQNYSFADLIDLISQPNQVLYNKVHSAFGIKYVNNIGINIEKLFLDLEKNSKDFLKFKKIKKWILKIWVKKTKATQVCFYLVSPNFYNNFNNLYSNIIDISKYFSSFTIFFESNFVYQKFNKQKFFLPFNAFIFDPNKNLKEEILKFVNNTVF